LKTPPKLPTVRRGRDILTSLRERLGLALQRQRQVHGLSQSQLANLAKLSLKYVGEIERGEANVSMEALERLTTALEWDPFELPLREQDTLPEGVRTLLLAELTHMQHLVQTAIGWVQTLDAAMVRRAAHADTAAGIGARWSEDTPLRPRRGRPRKTRATAEMPGDAEEDADDRDGLLAPVSRMLRPRLWARCCLHRS
jgi:transcriptional regulator with XRE-family HTH domain